MAPAGVFNPIEDEEDSLAYAFAATDKSTFDMSINGEFAENERDKQMTPRKFHKPENLTAL